MRQLRDTHRLDIGNLKQRLAAAKHKERIATAVFARATLKKQQDDAEVEEERATREESTRRSSAELADTNATTERKRATGEKRLHDILSELAVANNHIAGLEKERDTSGAQREGELTAANDRLCMVEREGVAARVRETALQKQVYEQQVFNFSLKEEKNAVRSQCFEKQSFEQKAL